MRERTVAAAALAAALVTLSAGDAQASFPGDDGLIAYVGLDSGGGTTGIHAVAADGTGDRRLTTSDDAFPRYSPDGGRIAFQRTPAGSAPQVWVMSADGSNQRLAFSPPAGAVDQQPAWSPDGRHIVFARSFPRADPSCGSRLSVGDVVTGSVYRLMSQCQDSEPRWSPDGSRIAYVHFARTTQAVEYVELAGLAIHKVTARSFPDAPDWSPDGSHLVMQVQWTTRSGAQQVQLERIRPDGTGRTVLTHFPGCQCSVSPGAIQPAYAPSGSRIVFSEFASGNLPQGQLALLPAAGGEPAALPVYGFEPDWQPR